MLAISVTRTPVRMSADFGKGFDKRVKKDTAKIQKAFDKINKESEERREKLTKHADELFKQLDELAKGDVKKLQELFAEEDAEKTVDIDDFVEVDGVVKFKE
ncbi:hypothetical protein PBCVNEJV1_453R [Paramecium bursaria Chlorella virus NE-JV-1]|jgi:hypothetical protein|nr:hypothetical protein PBCVNEJV1_453R [Paramecium bursaria Chlorella virus NE-JV-1]